MDVTDVLASRRINQAVGPLVCLCRTASPVERREQRRLPFSLHTITMPSLFRYLIRIFKHALTCENGLRIYLKDFRAVHFRPEW
jgi:hypothetical protein